MDNRAQISIEYLIMVGLGVVIAAVVIVLATNLIGIKEGIVEIIMAVRENTLQVI